MEKHSPTDDAPRSDEQQEHERDAERLMLQQEAEHLAHAKYCAYSEAGLDGRRVAVPDLAKRRGPESGDDDGVTSSCDLVTRPLPLRDRGCYNKARSGPICCGIRSRRRSPQVRSDGRPSRRASRGFLCGRLLSQSSGLGRFLQRPWFAQQPLCKAGAVGATPERFGFCFSSTTGRCSVRAPAEAGQSPGGWLAERQLDER